MTKEAWIFILFLKFDENNIHLICKFFFYFILFLKIVSR